MSVNLPQQVLHFIRLHDLVRPGDSVLVAVSGGADSVALIHILHELRRRLKLRLTVAHLNHKIRGRDAEEDARFVRRLARRLRLGFVGGSADVPRLARRLGISLEMAGRAARYKYFEQTPLARRCRVVATAHTANDNAETILLMLIRGCGLQGLTGIAPRAQVGKTNVIRPLLAVERRAIENYLRSSAIAWREDVSNADPVFLRNRVRHELLPLLEAKYNRGIKETLNRVGGVLREENDFIERFAEKAHSGAVPDSLLDGKATHMLDSRFHGNDRTGTCVCHSRLDRESRICPGRRTLNVLNLAKHHIAVRRRVLRRWLLANGVDSATVDFQLINRLDELIACPGRSGVLNLAGRLTVRKKNLFLTIGRAGASLHRRDLISTILKVPGTTVLPGSGLHLKARIGPGICRARDVFGRYPARASLSLKKWRRRIIRVRSWRAGDRMWPYGLDGSKKIQDIFSDAKVPVELRHKLPVFECGNEIIWIPGYRIASGWEVVDSANLALQLCVG